MGDPVVFSESESCGHCGQTGAYQFSTGWLCMACYTNRGSCCSEGENNMSQARTLEDFQPGNRFESGPIVLTQEEIIAFATKFDPQVFHLDPAAARESFFGELVASGWHTASTTMRLLVESGLNIAGGLIGAGIEEVRWLRPVRPGDALRVTVEVLEVLPSRSRPDRGTVRMRVVTKNQEGETVQRMIATVVAPSKVR